MLHLTKRKKQRFTDWKIKLYFLHENVDQCKPRDSTNFFYFTILWRLHRQWCFVYNSNRKVCWQKSQYNFIVIGNLDIIFVWPSRLVPSSPLDWVSPEGSEVRIPDPSVTWLVDGSSLSAGSLTHLAYWGLCYSKFQGQCCRFSLLHVSWAIVAMGHALYSLVWSMKHVIENTMCADRVRMVIVRPRLQS